MTKSAAETRAEMLDLLATNIEAATHAMKSAVHNYYVLTNADATLFVGEFKDGGGLRFVSPLADNIVTIPSLAKARSASVRWNSHLTAEQVKASCRVEALSFRKALERFIQTQRGLQAALAIV